jgi:hypothetical protein
MSLPKSNSVSSADLNFAGNAPITRNGHPTIALSPLAVRTTRLPRGAQRQQAAQHLHVGLLSRSRPSAQGRHPEA